MPQATIISSFTENGFACLAVMVNEGGRRTEYVGRVQLDEAWQAMSPAEKKAALVAAAKAARDASLPPAPQDLGLTGAVTI